MVGACGSETALEGAGTRQGTQMSCRSTRRRETKFVLTSEQHRVRAAQMRRVGKIEVASGTIWLRRQLSSKWHGSRPNRTNPRQCTETSRDRSAPMMPRRQRPRNSRCGSVTRARMSAVGLPPQPIDATQALNLSAGVSNCKVSRGRSLS